MVDRGFIPSGTVFQLCCRPPGDRGSPALCIAAGVRESNNAEFCQELWMGLTMVSAECMCNDGGVSVGVGVGDGEVDDG